jgi:hypothetical protein
MEVEDGGRYIACVLQFVRCRRQGKRGRGSEGEGKRRRHGDVIVNWPQRIVQSIVFTNELLITPLTLAPHTNTTLDRSPDVCARSLA